MLPSADELVGAWPFLSRRFRIEAIPSRGQIEAPLRLAAECAGESETDEPAALFFGLASFPGAIPGAWTVFAERVASAHAARQGRRLVAAAADLRTLRVDVARRRAGCAEVKACFARRLGPR